MAIMRVDEMRKTPVDKLDKKLEELNLDLMKMRTQMATGTAPENPGRVKELRRTIARIKTIRRELTKK